MPELPRAVNCSLLFSELPLLGPSSSSPGTAAGGAASVAEAAAAADIVITMVPDSPNAESVWPARPLSAPARSGQLGDGDDYP